MKMTCGIRTHQTLFYEIYRRLLGRDLPLRRTGKVTYEVA